MPFKFANKKSKLVNNHFLILLISQGISNLGDAFQLVAIPFLIIKLTGSGLSAAFGMVCTPLPSLLLSPLAGYIGDKFNEKYCLILLDLLRCIVVLLFIFNINIYIIYMLLLIMSSFDIIYNPAKNKMISTLLQSKDLILGYSLLSGVFGAAYIIGPFLAGIIITIWNVNIAFIVNSISFLLCAIIIGIIRLSKIKSNIKDVDNSNHNKIHTNSKN